MFNEAHIALSGFVATQPYLSQTRTGIPSLSMRVAWTPRRMDRVTGEWVDADTSFLTVMCYRKLAENAANCLRKGDPVVLRGRVSVRDFEDKNGLQRTRVEVDATSVGHDLSRGVAQFQRLRPQTGMTALEYRAAEESGSGDGVAEGHRADDAELASLMASAGERSGRLAEGAGSGDPDDDSGHETFDGDADTALAGQAAGVTAPF